MIPLSQSSELSEWMHGHAAHPHQRLPGEEDYLEHGAQAHVASGDGQGELEGEGEGEGENEDE